jgi:hypothetical protein
LIGWVEGEEDVEGEEPEGESPETMAAAEEAEEAEISLTRSCASALARSPGTTRRSSPSPLL